MFCSIFNASFHLKYISCWSEKQTEFGKIKIKANKLNFEKFKAKYGVPWIFFLNYVLVNHLSIQTVPYNSAFVIAKTGVSNYTQTHTSFYLFLMPMNDQNCKHSRQRFSANGIL